MLLFVATCFSTFWVGANGWLPMQYAEQSLLEGSLMPIRVAVVRHFGDGLVYMACLLGILFAHEMGHFVATVRHRIPASLPYFLPLPISPIGTLGAVIGMDGLRADRRQLFDIGLAGPLAGLVVAAPILCYGVAQLDLTQTAAGPMTLESPLVVRLLLNWLQPPGYEYGRDIWPSQLNPYYMAGWVGMIITGLNMFPLSQLDGGHVAYVLLGKKAHWLARVLMVGAIAYMVYSGSFQLLLMAVLILALGVDHPPTRDDRAPLGWGRRVLGWLSFTIPILCFPPHVIRIVEGM